MLIGVVGTFAAGKDTVAEYLVEKGFSHYSTGDLVRAYITDNQLGGLDRDNLRKIATKLRAEKGTGILVEMALADQSRPMVISGIRNPGEVNALKKAGGTLIAVDAPIERRYAWAKARGRLDDVVTSEDFKRQEAAEETDNPAAPQITAVIALADFDVANDGSLADLHQKIDTVLEHLEAPVKSVNEQQQSQKG